MLAIYNYRIQLTLRPRSRLRALWSDFKRSTVSLAAVRDALEVGLTGQSERSTVVESLVYYNLTSLFDLDRVTSILINFSYIYVYYVENYEKNAQQDCKHPTYVRGRPRAGS